MTGRLRPGTDFAGYLIEYLLAEGGMGAVYVARHPRLPRLDAVKVLSAEHCADPEFRARFLREADLAARINHPNVVAVHDRGVFDGQLWIAMQYVPGSDAAALLAHGPLAAERAVDIVEQAARGLDEAHRAGMIHRDVKPANLLIDTRPGRPDRVLVSDFGIGRSVTDSTALTAAGTVLATLAYAAPEQLMGERADHRADVYGLGATLYHLLTGTVPFPRPTPEAVIEAHLTAPPPRPTAARPELPMALDAVIARAMDKDPGRRYPSCGALAADARAALTTMPVPAARPRRSRRRRLVELAAAAGIVTAIVTATAVALHQNSSSESAHPTSAASASATTPASSISRTAGTTTTTKPAATWGSYSFIAQKFPDLLPTSPDAAGFQGIRCAAVTENSSPADISVPATGIAVLACNGDKHPLHQLKVACNVDRSVWTPTPLSDGDTTDGSQSWTRPSGSGWMTWGHFFVPEGNTTVGVLDVTFDANTGRDFCFLAAFAQPDAQALVDTWWPGLPL
ncbi:serine/threonine-protein kinase [Nocardia sp. CDC160]|uniref:serine/threonine-protein kinase n=1 Tax=Nocardia sp. CDC160 TaxID=3112166 RepID=UPI002DBB9D2E|nr:serine/threonine-protein kinase [Nocardia sp. CDC160]MEC3919422.1 serine/threonine-protein kinase [Nocardia sp. CDC160]